MNNSSGNENVFQFTPPHRGHLNEVKNLKDWVEVSIHAPAQGASRLGNHVVYLCSQFQFTPPHRGPLTFADNSVYLMCFNSRPRTGVIPTE